MPVAGHEEPIRPAADTLPILPFRYSVRSGQGLPPGVLDSLAHRLGADTLIRAEVTVYPVYSQQPMQLAVRALAKDTTVAAPRSVPVGYAARPVVLRLHRSGDRLDPPAWRRSQRCLLYSHRFQLEPGQSWVLQHDLPISEIPAHLRSGRVYLTAWLPGAPGATLAAGVVEIADPARSAPP